jgi:hypothetical protein
MGNQTVNPGNIRKGNNGMRRLDLGLETSIGLGPHALQGLKGSL